MGVVRLVSAVVVVLRALPSVYVSDRLHWCAHIYDTSALQCTVYHVAIEFAEK